MKKITNTIFTLIALILLLLLCSNILVAASYDPKKSKKNTSHTEQRQNKNDFVPSANFNPNDDIDDGFGKDTSRIDAWTRGLKEKYSSESYEKALFDYYQLQYPENIKKAEKEANKLISDGSKMVKEGKRLMSQEDSKVKSFDEGGGYRLVSREANRAEGRDLFSRGTAKVIKGEAIKKIVRDTINALVKPEMIKLWTSKEGKKIRGAVLELEGDTIKFITPKMKYMEFNISLLNTETINDLRTPKFDLKIDISPNVYSGRLINGDNKSNPVQLRFSPKADNVIKKIPLKLEIKADDKIIGKYEKDELISLSTEQTIFIPNLDWNIDELVKLKADEAISLDVKASTGNIKKSIKSILSIKPPLVYADLEFCSMFNGKIFPSVILSKMEFHSEKGLALFPLRKIQSLKNLDTVLSNGNPFLGFKIKINESNGFDSSDLKLTISTNSDIFKLSTSTQKIPLEDLRKNEFFVYPKIDWNFKKLKEIKEPIAINIKIKYQLDNQDENTEMATLVVHPVNDVLMRAKDPVYDVVRNYDNMFAAFVNEHHPMIKDIKQEALNLGLLNSFSGEQEGIDGIIKQLNAIWTVLQKRGIKYSSYTESLPDDSENIVISQRVRFIDETINSQQANCADGSILFASIFKNIGLRPCLIVAPGHMYCGIIYNNKILPIETTLIGTGRSLKDAILTGMKNLEKRQENLEAVDIVEKNYGLNYDIKNNILDNFRIIDISQCRNMGILPIASKYFE